MISSNSHAIIVANKSLRPAVEINNGRRAQVGLSHIIHYHYENACFDSWSHYKLAEIGQGYSEST